MIVVNMTYSANTSAPWGNPQSLTDKRFWLEDYLEFIHKKLFTTHRKDLLIGDYLIDDRLKNEMVISKVNF